MSGAGSHWNGMPAAGVAVLAGHVLMVAAAVGLAAGAVGFFASLWFVQRLYEAAKAD